MTLSDSAGHFLPIFLWLASLSLALGRRALIWGHEGTWTLSITPSSPRLAALLRSYPHEPGRWVGRGCSLSLECPSPLSDSQTSTRTFGFAQVPPATPARLAEQPGTGTGTGLVHCVSQTPSGTSASAPIRPCRVCCWDSGWPDGGAGLGVTSRGSSPVSIFLSSCPS